MLKIEGLKKYFPLKKTFAQKATRYVYAVDDISFEVNKNEAFGLVGESGCGKTTTAKCIMRILDPTDGHIFFSPDNQRIIDLANLQRRNVRRYRNEFQMIFQDPYSSLNPRFSVFDIIGEPLLVHGVKDRKNRQEIVRELLQQVGLRPEYMSRYPHAFSGGERQRISIARALALDPKLIVADEPVSALDVSVQAQILNLLMRLQEEHGLTYIFVSHDLSVVRHICTKVAVMYVGKIVEISPTHNLFENPQHPYTEALLEAVPKPDPKLRSKQILLPGEVANPANPPSGCYFHPRCKYAIDECSNEYPQLKEISPKHYVSCHRSQELHLKGIS